MKSLFGPDSLLILTSDSTGLNQFFNHWPELFLISVAKLRKRD